MHYCFKVVCISIAVALSIPCLAAQTAVKKALSGAYKDIEHYLAKASQCDKTNLAEYLQYYRSEGGYQAVSPAPSTLREALSPAAQALFKKLIKRARPFTRKAKPLPGSSRLTAEGEEFYRGIITFINESIRKSQPCMTPATA
jgi:hypothetical protein